MPLAVLFQRLEAIALFVVATYFYAALGYSAWWFAALLLAVDVSILGYLFGNRIGAAVYNAGHSLIIPLIGLATAYILNNSALAMIALIWLAHIGMDRMLGFGLKTGKDFGDTHLGRIGKRL